MQRWNSVKKSDLFWDCGRNFLGVGLVEVADGSLLNMVQVPNRDSAPRCSAFVTETSAFGPCWLLGDEHGDSDDEMHRSGDLVPFRRGLGGFGCFVCDGISLNHLCL